jgi:hypothetical protein
MPDYEGAQAAIAMEPFSTSRIYAVFQALRVSGLVKRESGWLQQEQPGTVQRYERLGKAQRNIRRLAASQELSAYGIHAPSGASIGLATVIKGQHVIHPHAGEIMGDDIDYWLGSAQTNDVHAAVVKRLCDRQGNRPTFATIVLNGTQATAKADSFGYYMNPVDGPTELIAAADDYYDVARKGEIVQVYQLA